MGVDTCPKPWSPGRGKRMTLNEVEREVKWAKRQKNLRPEDAENQ